MRPDTLNFKKERFGTTDVLKDLEHNGEVKGKGIGLSPTGGAI